jgi:membrane-associated phospholipid phosphatase
MKSFIELIKRNKHILLLLYWPVHFTWYQIVRIYSDQMPRFYIVSSPLDEYIPFFEWFVIPYISWYFYIVVVLVYSAFKGKREFLRANGMVMGCMLVSMLITTIFPSGVSESIRPDFAALGRESILIDAVKYLYIIDSPPRVVMPSMHAGVAAALFVVVLKAESLRGHKWIKACSFLLSLLICMSIVLIKQHSILDGIAGIALVVPLYFAVYHWLYRANSEKT